MKRITPLIFSLLFLLSNLSPAQQLSLDDIYASGKYRQQFLPPFQWLEEGDYMVRLESGKNGQAIVRYETDSNQADTLVSSSQLTPNGASKALRVQGFSFSEDESKILFFTNSSRVWRANTKGDYWIYDLKTASLRQLGKKFPASSLMFAKLSSDNSQVAYVQDFNLYMEDVMSGEVVPMTTDGGDGIINGTFDWAYEEEFGARDGFRWNPDGNSIAYWQLDASKTGTFYMIDNTDSVYSEPIPIQYPKVGMDPSSCKVGIVQVQGQKTKWIKLEGSTVQNYIPAMQWVDKNTLLIQQLNRHQNHLKVWSYKVSEDKLKLIYEEKGDRSWVDIQYPDLSSSNWGDNSLKIVDKGKAFLRMEDWGPFRKILKVKLDGSSFEKLFEPTFDVASIAQVTKRYVYFHASPDNSTQRYLYRAKLKAGEEPELLTPAGNDGINTYRVSPNGEYAIHTHRAALEPSRIDLVYTNDHEVIRTLVDNKEFRSKLEDLDLPTVEFKEIEFDKSFNLMGDVRIIKPPKFDPAQKYPVLFHVYGEPWGQVATDNFIGMWNIFLAQQGYVIVDMDPQGTPCLKGSRWRKSIYRQIGRLNIRDLGFIAREVVKLPYIDAERTAVWGWSGGGSSTLNLMFQFPEIFHTGMSVAPVANQLTYDNIYQERYMGLPQENKEDFVQGSPVTYAQNLQGNLLIVHGTGDDNVHYQNTEMLVNELIKHNKQFQMMAYPNRSHGIYEGRNTRRHLYTLLTNYLMEKVPVNPQP